MGALFNVRSADGCAMAEILVLDVCARRLSAAGDLFLWGVNMTRRCVSTRPDVRLFPLFCALFFPLFFPCYPLFLRRRPFSRCRKGLHCNSVPFPPVNRLYFFRGPLPSRGPTIQILARDRPRLSSPVKCTPRVRHETRDWLRSQQLAAVARRRQAVAGLLRTRRAAGRPAPSAAADDCTPAR